MTNRLLAILITLALQVTISVWAAERTIYVLSDAHVMDPSLVDSPTNKAWKNFLQTDKTMPELSARIFDLLVDKIIAEKPDLLLMPGDLTKDGEVVSHQYVVQRLARIEAAGIPVYVIPGNHDRGWMDDALVYANDTCTAAEMLDNNGFAEYYRNYGYDSDTEHYENTLTYTVDPLPGLTLIGIDTGIWSQYRDETVDWVCDKALRARRKGNQVIVMQHHLLMPHYYDQNEIFELSTPENYSEVRERFIDAGIKVVLSGHTHASDIARYTNADGQEIYDICTGTPIAYPCDFRVLTINEPFTQLKVATRSLLDTDGISEQIGIEQFPIYAEDRLLQSSMRWANRWLKTKNFENEFLASEVAYCFVIHAEGDEPENPESDNELAFFRILLDKIAPLLGEQVVSMTQTISESIKSMLGDYSDPEHKTNVVKDRSLTITMPTTIPSGIQTVQTATATDDGKWYTLQGIPLASKPTHKGIYIRNGRKTIVE